MCEEDFTHSNYMKTETILICTYIHSVMQFDVILNFYDNNDNLISLPPNSSVLSAALPG